MVDNDSIMCAMAATTLADETPCFNAGPKYVLVGIAKDFPIWNLRMDSYLQGHGLWLLVKDGPTDAKGKRLMMRHLGNNVIAGKALHLVELCYGLPSLRHTRT